MSKKYKKYSKKNLFINIFTIILLIYCMWFYNTDDTYGMKEENPDDIKISYIDVGQGDCILIQNKNENMLIDAGNNEDGEKLVNYFNNLGIYKFKYIFATHPHEDHIGGLDNIINSFEIENIYMPDVITTTTTFEEVIDAIDKKNLKITIPKIDDTIYLKDASIKIIYTGKDTNDLNNSSIVLKLIYKNTSFLFTADATKIVENKIINKDIESTVLKVGHHGSKYSSTTKFLKKVNPKYAIISAGENNIYNHPDKSTLNKLNKLNITTYRTDKLGTIVVTSNGKKINITNYNTNTNGG